MKCKHTIFCLQRIAYSQFIPSCGEQHGGCRRRQTTNWCDILIVVTKYSKVRKWKHFCSIVFTLLYGCKQFLVIILYLTIYQSWDICVLIRFMSHFWSKISKWMGCNKNFLTCIRKKIGCGWNVYSVNESMVK